MTIMHFFASRADGEDKSAPIESWRYGKGNVHVQKSFLKKLKMRKPIWN
jgi:hypothetical protein